MAKYPWKLEQHQYLEAIARIGVALPMIEALLGELPVVKKHPEIRAQVDEAKAWLVRAQNRIDLQRENCGKA